MKNESINYNLQLLIFPGICVLGLILCLIMGKIDFMPFFFGISTFLRTIFSFLGKIYGKGHWYSKKECILDGIIFLILGIVGELELVTYIYFK